MTVPVWQPGATYAPGAIVVPRSGAPPAFTGLTNPTLSTTTGWDFVAPLEILADGLGYGGQGRISLSGTTTGATAMDQAHIPMVPGQSLGVTCMCQHGTSSDHSSDAALTIHWYDVNNNDLNNPANGTGLPSLSNGGWQQLSVSGNAPANVSYARIGISMNRTGTDSIQTSNFQINYTPQATTPATMYQATQAQPGKSGNTEPVWPALGASVQDNQVTWKGVNIDRLVWQASPMLQSGTTEPVWPTSIGGTVSDGTVDWIAYTPIITDVNAPNTTIATMAANKVFVGDFDVTKYCATNDATDWSTEQDAGYLPTGLQAVGETNVTALGIYRANLIAWTASSMQVWQVDPDPANMAFIDSVEGAGTSFYRSPAGMGNDLFFLSLLGVRSVGITATTGTMGGTDIGSPIDPLVRSALAGMAAGTDPIGVYYANANQYWLFIGAQVFVFSLSMPAKVKAWSRYTFAFTVTDVCTLGGSLYVRDSNNNVYVLDETVFADNGVNYEVDVQWQWLGLGAQGVTKMIIGMDAILYESSATPVGTYLSIGYDETDETARTPEILIAGDTQPGAIVPFQVLAPSASPKLRHVSANEWEASGITMYFDIMRPTA